MEIKEKNKNINQLRMVAELSKDVIDKQWQSIDSLRNRAALMITTITIFLGFVLKSDLK